MTRLHRRPIDDPARQIAYRQRILPEQLDRARRRYQGLVREAHRLGMAEILQDNERHEGGL